MGLCGVDLMNCGVGVGIFCLGLKKRVVEKKTEEEMQEIYLNIFK